MHQYIFDVYSYGSTETTVEAWGYDNGTWFNATAKSSNPNILVRFAYDNTGKAVIYIGSYTQYNISQQYGTDPYSQQSRMLAAQEF